MWGQREKIQNGQMGIKGLETGVGRKCSISRGRLDCTVEVYISEESYERVTVLQVATRQGGSSKSESCQEF